MQPANVRPRSLKQLGSSLQVLLPPPPPPLSVNKCGGKKCKRCCLTTPPQSVFKQKNRHKTRHSSRNTHSEGKRQQRFNQAWVSEQSLDCPVARLTVSHSISYSVPHSNLVSSSSIVSCCQAYTRRWFSNPPRHTRDVMP